MTDKLKRLLERTQINETKAFLSADEIIDKHPAHRWDAHYLEGAKYENARLLPILQAQARIIERLSEAVRYNTINPKRIDIMKASEEALAFAEAELDRTLGE